MRKLMMILISILILEALWGRVVNELAWGSLAEMFAYFILIGFVAFVGLLARDFILDLVAHFFGSKEEENGQP
jgi:hypothetical protein